MELKSKNTTLLKSQLNKIRKIMQILTWILIAMFLVYIYGWILKNENWNKSFTLIMIPISFIIILLDKKSKKIKAKLNAEK